MENYNETKDFEEMRQQIGLLKEKLHTQRIVNEEIIRQTIQEKVSAVHNISWRIILIGLMEIPLVLWIFRGLLGFSWGFCLLTVAFVALAVVCHLLMDLSVNISLEGALDLGWKILADCFDKDETGIKSELISEFWPNK